MDEELLLMIQDLATQETRPKTKTRILLSEFEKIGRQDRPLLAYYGVKTIDPRRPVWAVWW